MCISPPFPFLVSDSKRNDPRLGCARAIFRIVQLEVYGRHVSIKMVSNLSCSWPFGLCFDLLLYRSFLQGEKGSKINELQLALTCFGFLWTIFFRYPTLYIDIKDSQLSLTTVGIVSLLLVILLGVAYKVLKFMGLICWWMVIMQCCEIKKILTVKCSGLFLFFCFTR